jgi:glycosyltransferase involved in cell wall biosynthesis
MKRLDKLIEVFCAAELPNCVLLIVGPGAPAYVEALKQLRSKVDRAGRVQIRDPIFGQGKDRLFRAVDGYVSYSARENFGRAAAEALAAGLPIILSQGNDLGTDLAGVDCGWLLTDEQPESLQTALGEFAAASDEELARKGRAGQQWTEEHLGFARFQESIETLARNSLKGARYLE